MSETLKRALDWGSGKVTAWNEPGVQIQGWVGADPLISLRTTEVGNKSRQYCWVNMRGILPSCPEWQYKYPLEFSEVPVPKSRSQDRRQHLHKSKHWLKEGVFSSAPAFNEKQSTDSDCHLSSDLLSAGCGQPVTLLPPPPNPRGCWGCSSSKLFATTAHTGGESYKAAQEPWPVLFKAIPGLASEPQETQHHAAHIQSQGSRVSLLCTG